jgi:quinol monooxygenase YgiN
MQLTRRDLVVSGMLVGTIVLTSCASLTREKDMYGLIGKALAKPGERDALIGILLEGATTMPGCLSYLVAKDPTNENAIWITEVWDSEASHRASLNLPSVKAAISRGRPLIAGFGERFVTEPVGGHGLATGTVK